MEFDPRVVSYNTLLDEFFGGHDAGSRRQTQYASLIFYHNEAQRSAAEAALRVAAAARGGRLATQVVCPFPSLLFLPSSTFVA